MQVTEPPGPGGPLAVPVAEGGDVTTLGSGRITTVAAGAGPHVSFSDAPPYDTARWGDYSFAQPDPDGNGVWLATEYIPPAANQDPMDNWGTYVFKVKGS